MSVELTLENAVKAVLGQLTGLELTYDPNMDRFRAVARALNSAVQLMALEKEWSWYASTQTIGTATEGERMVMLPPHLRPRIIGDDAVRLVKVYDDDTPDRVVRWAYFLPRDALHKYENRGDLHCAVLRQELQFSRPFLAGEDGLDIQVPVMREPELFELPDLPQIDDPLDAEITPIPQEVLDQVLDFPYPQVIVMRAAFLYAQSDPIMQPRVQSLEAQYKDLMYQIIEREERHTDMPFLNEWTVPVVGSINGGDYGWHGEPHADIRRY